jgi:hypothetical protein
MAREAEGTESAIGVLRCSMARAVHVGLGLRYIWEESVARPARVPEPSDRG